MENRTFKLVLVGDGGVGKTNFARKVLTNDFERKYIPTIGVEVHPICFHTSQGKICFNTWETAGQEKLGGMRDGYYINTDCVIVFGSVDSVSSFNNMERWKNDVLRVSPGAKIVFVGNKFDLPKNQHVVNEEEKRNHLPYYDVSVESQYQIEKPFLQLARDLTGNQNLTFVSPLPFL